MTLNLGCLHMAVSQDPVMVTGTPEKSMKLRRVSEDKCICKQGMILQHTCAEAGSACHRTGACIFATAMA